MICSPATPSTQIMISEFFWDRLKAEIEIIVGHSPLSKNEQAHYYSQLYQYALNLLKENSSEKSDLLDYL